MDPGSHGGFAEVLGVWCAFVVRAGHLYCCVFYRCTKRSVFYFTHGLILIRIGHVLSREVGKDMVHLVGYSVLVRDGKPPARCGKGQT